MAISYLDVFDVVTMREAAKLLGVQPKTLALWIESGHITAVKMPKSGYRRIPRSEVVRVIREEIAEARLERGGHR